MTREAGDVHVSSHETPPDEPGAMVKDREPRAKEPAAPLDVDAIRADFPILATRPHGQRLAYLDSGASAQRPVQVLDAMDHLYRSEYANIHRGVYWLSQRSTQLYEEARNTVRWFVGAKGNRETIFTRGTTEAINLVAEAWGQDNLGEGDVVLVTRMEHHSNIVPWQIVCERTGAKVVPVEVLQDGSLDMDDFEAKLDERVKMVAITHVSNVLGTINPVREICQRAHAVGAKVLVDGAQAIPHLKIDVQDLGCDFYTFSGHKVFGPSGIGALIGRIETLRDMRPYQGGGGMIQRVSFEEGTTYADVPERFEAGTPSIAGAIGLAAALRYLSEVGVSRVTAHEADLLDYGTALLEEIPGLTIYGTAEPKASVLSFTMAGAHPHDIGTILDRCGVAVRAGHHCAQPLMDFYGVPATVRASLALYNTREDLDQLAAALRKVREVFGG